MTVVPRYAPYAELEPTGVSVPLDLPPGHVPRPIAGGNHADEASSNAAAGHLAASSAKHAAAAGDESKTAHGDRQAEGEAEALPLCAELWECRQGGVRRVFVEHPLFASPDIYGSTADGSKSVYTYAEAGDHPNLDLRYSVLCQAALAAPVLLDDLAGDGSSHPAPPAPVVFVANDWPTVLLLLRLQYSVRAAVASVATPGLAGRCGASSDALAALRRLLAERLAPRAASVYCIHNLAYQGLLPAEAFARLSLPQAALPALCTSADWHEVLQQLQGNVEISRSCSSQHAVQTCTQAAELVVLGCGCSSDALDTQACTRVASASAADQAPVLVSSSSPDTAAAAVARAEAGECPNGQLNQMRAALLTADCLVTVSQGYALEVQQAGPFGCGMHGILAVRGISGIMNGLDTEEWDPAADPHLPPECRYNASTVARGKAHMKALLRERLGLAAAPDAPLVGFVGRLTRQKGVDVIMAAVPALLMGSQAAAPCRWHAEPAAKDEGNSSFQPVPAQHIPHLDRQSMQLVLLGTGESWMETALTGLEQSFPGQAVGLTTFSEELAHWIMAASDFVLVPSRFEPCGLVAQAAARYGAVPIVCAVGGLKDLVTEEVGYTVPGFSHSASAADHRQNVQQLLGVLQEAMAEFGSLRYRTLQQNCMALDVSWERPAEEWERLLRKVIHDRVQAAPC